MANGIETTKGTSKETSETPVSPVNPGKLKMGGLIPFPWLLPLSIVQLAIYLHNFYQDSAAGREYFRDKNLNYCMVSAASHFGPVLVYIIYKSVYVKKQGEPKTKEVGRKVVHGELPIPVQTKRPEEVYLFLVFCARLAQLLSQLYSIVVALEEKQPYKTITNEIVASGLTLMAMMAAVRRRDDGILTGTLSVIGWMSIMISRSVAITLAARVIYGWMLLICVAHGLLVTAWVTSIAIGTYQESSPMNKKRKTSLYFRVFAFFGLPSLTYWPIMFELRKDKRPLIFLCILLLENVLFVVLWALMRENRTWYTHDFILVAVTAGCFVFGSLFIFLYICLKPPYTDDVVYHDMKASDTDSFGMYFEFCDRVFKISKLKVVETMLKEIRQQKAAPRG